MQKYFYLNFHRKLIQPVKFESIHKTCIFYGSFLKGRDWCDRCDFVKFFRVICIILAKFRIFSLQGSKNFFAVLNLVTEGSNLIGIFGTYSSRKSRTSEDSINFEECVNILTGFWKSVKDSTFQKTKTHRQAFLHHPHSQFKIFNFFFYLNTESNCECKQKNSVEK